MTFVYGIAQGVDDLGAGVTRKVLAHGGGLMQVEVAFAAGAVGPLHSHPHEQLTCVLSGTFVAGLLQDTFTPQRADFLRVESIPDAGVR